MTTKEESEGYPFLYASSSRGRSHIGSVVHESTSKARVDVGINDDEIASWLDLPNLNFVMNVCFMLPLYFREREITVSSSSNQIAEYEMQPALAKSCDVHAIRYSSWNLKKKQRMDTPANDASVDVIVPITVDDRALAQNEYFVVEIRHKTLGVLLNKRYYEADLPTDASQAEASLWKVFRLFETSTSLRPYLLGVKERQEPASSWLFGLLGFNVVCLAFKNISERMLDTSGKERGSCDLIVQDPESGAILVVDDTQSRPDDKKIDAIRGTARFITEQTGIPLTPVILAGEECNTIKRTLQSDAVRVIDRADVNGIVDLIEKGDVKRARDLLIGLVQKPPPYVNPFG
jgi:hypothetical protein